MNTIQSPEETQDGLTVEHILLSITVVSRKGSAGQFDDSAAYQVDKALYEYHGVKSVHSKVLYNNTKIEHHQNGCTCHHCTWDGVLPLTVLPSEGEALNEEPK